MNYPLYRLKTVDPTRFLVYIIEPRTILTAQAVSLHDDLLILMTPEEIRALLGKVEKKEAEDRADLRRRLKKQEREQRAFVYEHSFERCEREADCCARAYR